MVKFFTLLAVLYYISAAKAEASEDWSWNTLLHAEGIFHNDINSIQSKSAEKEVVLSELQSLLNQEPTLQSLYANYLSTFEKPLNRSNGHLLQEKLLGVARHNLEAREGMHSWVKGVNLFSDMTEEEIGAYMGTTVGISPSYLENGGKVIYPEPTQADSVDWNATGYVTPVKDQGQCGSCVPFSTAAALESAIAISYDKIFLDLSEQQILDCTLLQGNLGCAGGHINVALEYLMKGVTTEKSYPYLGFNFFCLSFLKYNIARVTDFALIQPSNDENALKNGVAKGPTPAAINANKAFQEYKDGIFDAECEGNVNHAVLIVGYGSENGKDFWLVKNSWSQKWGKEGFIKVARNNKNQCSIASGAFTVEAKERK